MKPRFQPPTPAEVTAYAQSIDFRLDGEEFCSFYESKGWLVGRTPMVNWKAAVVTWKKRQANQPQAFQPTQYQRQVSERQSARAIREKQLEAYLEEIKAYRSWKGSSCPFGDPEQEESRLWSKIRDNFDASFVAELKTLLRDGK